MINKCGKQKKQQAQAQQQRPADTQKGNAYNRAYAASMEAHGYTVK